MHTRSAAEKARIIDRLSHSVVHTHLQGICLESINGDELTMKLPYRKELVGNLETGATHGGALTVLLDHTLGTACICCDQIEAAITPTLDLRIDHLSVAPADKDILQWPGYIRSREESYLRRASPTVNRGIGPLPKPLAAGC